MSTSIGPAQRPARFAPWLPYAVGPVLIAVLVAALAGVAIWTEQLRYRERAAVATQNLARLLDAHVADMFDKIDVFLQLVALDYSDTFADGKGDPARINQFLAAHKVPLTEVSSLRIADEQGRIRYGDGVPVDPPLSVADREYFRRAQAGGPMGGLVIDGPLESRISGQWVLIFARGLYRADGRFLGVVYANLVTDRFGKRFAELELGSRGAVGLRTIDLALVHRFPAGAGVVPVGTRDVSEELRTAIAQNPLAGFYVASNTGVERSNVYRKVRSYPFYLIVGLATDDFLEGWRANTLLFSALAGLTIALTLIACVALYRASRRQIEAMSNRYAAIVQTSSDAIIGASISGVVSSWNRGAQEIFGFPADEMLGRPLRTLLPPERQDEDAVAFDRIGHGEPVESFESLRLRKDGTAIHVSLAISPVLDGSGNLIGVSVIARDISRQKAMEEEIRAMAFNDPLTRLPNRRLLMDRLRRAQLKSRRQRTYFAVLFIDLDKFKQVNDHFGHEGGDQLLIEVAKRLQLAVRLDDTVARLGGDEFVVVLEELGSSEDKAVDHVNTVADKILNMLEQDCMIGGRRHQGSASVGIRLLIGSDSSAEAILKEADAAMYSVKRERRVLSQGVFE